MDTDGLFCRWMVVTLIDFYINVSIISVSPRDIFFCIIKMTGILMLILLNLDCLCWFQFTDMGGLQGNKLVECSYLDCSLCMSRKVIYFSFYKSKPPALIHEVIKNPNPANTWWSAFFAASRHACILLYSCLSSLQKIRCTMSMLNHLGSK